MKPFLFLLISLLIMSCNSEKNDLIESVPLIEADLAANEDIIENETDSIFHYVRAHRYLELNNIKAAESRFQKVVELEPDFARGWLGLSQVAYLNAQLDKSTIYIDKAISLKPDLEEAIYHKAKLEKELGNCNKSIIIINSSISSKYPPLKSLLALCKGLLGDHKSAEILFDASYQNIDKFKNVILKEAEYMMSIGNHNESLKLTNEYLDIHQSPEAYILKGMILVNLGLTNEALELFEEAKIMSSNPKVIIFYKKAKELIEINSR
tara:strand:- start:528 stop:1325 length:798 start_codon:yes stop_codon:yes gene_type:complete